MVNVELNTHLLCGQVQTTIKHYDTAHHHLQKALELTQATNTYQMELRCYKALADLFAAQGNFQQAYTYHQIYADKKDTLFMEHVCTIGISKSIDSISHAINNNIILCI